MLALRKEQAAARLKLGTAWDVRGLGVVFGDGAGRAEVAAGRAEPVRQTLCGRAGIGTELDATGAAAHVRLGAV